MGQICVYIEELAYNQPFEGNIKGKHIKTKSKTIGNDTFITTESEKAIWVVIRSGKNKREIRFPMPISQMRNIEKVILKGKPYIVYEMIQGMHWSATFGKKDKATGKRKFRPKKSCFNCASYSPTQKYLQDYPPRQGQGQSYASSGKNY